MSHLTIFVLLLILFPLTQSRFPSCTTEQIYQFVKRCQPLEEDLGILRNHSKHEPPRAEILLNMTDLCQKVSNCYGSIQCQESIDKMNKNNGFCEEDQYIFGDVPECIKWFFKEVYTMDYYGCLKEYEFLSHNLTIKRLSFTSGESCVLQVFNESQFFECERDSVEFITGNYDKIIDYLTINPGTKPSCHGVYPVYQKLQCEVIKDVLDEKRKELDENRDNNKTEINEFEELGKTVKDCMSHSCLYTAKDFREVDFQIGMTKLTNSPVLDCFQKIKEMKLDLSEKYPCTKDKELARKKECKLPIFRDFCGEEVAESYEENEEFMKSLTENRPSN
ncbi:unnamed protein product [Caenorhabditis brenneri]